MLSEPERGFVCIERMERGVEWFLSDEAERRGKCFVSEKQRGEASALDEAERRFECVGQSGEEGRVHLTYGMGSSNCRSDFRNCEGFALLYGLVSCMS